MFIWVGGQAVSSIELGKERTPSSVSLAGCTPVPLGSCDDISNFTTSTTTNPVVIFAVEWFIYMHTDYST